MIDGDDDVIIQMTDDKRTANDDAKGQRPAPAFDDADEA